MDNSTCSNVLLLSNLTSKCLFVKNNADCQNVQGLINYLEFVFCDFKTTTIPPFIISCLWLVLLFITVGRTADDCFCPSLEVISKFLKLIHGVTFLAFGNGAPDIFSSIAGVNQLRPELVIGALFGAGIFVTTVVAGSIILVSPFDMMQRPFLRDVIFYMFAVYFTFYLFYSGKITIYHSVGFIIFYLIYLIVVLLGHYVYQKWLKPKTLIDLVKKSSTIVITVADSTGTIIAQNLEDEDKKESEEPYLCRRRSLERRYSYASNFSRSGSQCSLNSEATTASTTSLSSLSLDIPSKKHSLGNDWPHSSKTLTVPKIQNMNEETPLLASLSATNLVAHGIPEFQRFIRTVSPINFNYWKNASKLQKILSIISSPLLLLLKLTVPVVDHVKPDNNWCRSLIALNIFIGPVIFCFAFGYGSVVIASAISVWVIVLIISAIISIVILSTSQNERPPVYHVVFAFAGFLASVFWIYCIASEIISILKMVGVVMHISDTILGLTVLAWGNSLSDLIADISLARQGLPRMGMSGCFGGPLFNLVMGIGIPFTMLTLQRGPRTILVQYLPSMTILTVFLCVSLTSSLIVIPSMRFHTYKPYGFYLFGLYLIFLTLSILNEVIGF